MAGTTNPEPVNRMSTSTRAEVLLWAARASVDTPASRAVYWAVSRLDSTAVLSRHVWIKDSVCGRGKGGGGCGKTCQALVDMRLLEEMKSGVLGGVANTQVLQSQSTSCSCTGRRNRMWAAKHGTQ